jgi:hypothetical protein
MPPKTPKAAPAQGADEWLDSPKRLTDTVAQFELSKLGNRGTIGITLVGGTAGAQDRHHLGPGRTKIGRSADCDICIDNTQMSRNHAVIEVSKSGVQITDVGSSNGTYVNGHKVREAKIQHGDHVGFGHELQFVVEGRTVEAPPAAKKPPASAQMQTLPTKVELAAEQLKPKVGGVESIVEELESERRQLAILFQLALRYLGRGRTSPCEVLFDVLDRIVAFDAAFISSTSGTFEAHPAGTRLADRACATLLGAAKPGAVTVLDKASEVITVGEMKVGSRAFIPVKGGFLVLVATSVGAYSGQTDFLSLLGQLHATAME